jgi:hypothetical protein
VLFLFLSLCFLILVFTGLGQISFAAIKSSPPRNPFLYLILGIFWTSLSGMLFSLFSPLNQYFLIFIALIGLLGFFFYKKQFIFYFISKKQTYQFLAIYIPTLIALTCLFSCLIYNYNSDTDLYHANAVEWIKQYGTVPGLANLHARLGVNTSWHILAAIIDHSIWTARSSWILSTLSYTTAIGYFYWEFFYGEKLWQKAYSLAILPWIFYHALLFGFPSLYYDFIALFMNSVLVYEVIYLSSYDKFPFFNLNDAIILGLLGFASFILKPMGVVSILFAGSFVLIALYKNKNLSIKNFIFISFCPLFIIIIWLARNIILSGWPFFPSTILSLPLDWTAPLSITQSIYNDIIFWARMPGTNYLDVGTHSFSFWFIPWLRHAFLSLQHWLQGILPFMGGIFTYSYVLSTKISKRVLFFFFWSIASLAYWFILAPDIRFADGLFFTFLATGVAFLCKDINFVSSLIEAHASKIIYSILIIFLTTMITAIASGKLGPISFLSIGKHLSGPVISKDIFSQNHFVMSIWMPVPLETCNRHKGLRLCPQQKYRREPYVACGNSPLPCTQDLNQNLRLRENFKLIKGFFILK